MSYAVGIDIGGTHIEAVSINTDFKIVRKEKMPLPAKKNKKIVTAKLMECLEKLCGEKGLTCIGIAVPGIIKNGVVEKSPNLPFLKGTDFKSLISKRFRTKVVVENDVKCMAFGESMRRKERNFIVLTLGTGIGGGLVINGNVHYGMSSAAGEVGHMSIKFDGPECVCGNLGCFEEYASIRAVRRLSSKIMGKGMEPHEVFNLAEKGDKKAKDLWKEYGKIFGIGLSNLCFILDPELIVLGGGISKAFRYFKNSMLEEMKKRMFIPVPKIEAERENANAYGAACMALKIKF
jgi:glucokinase